MTLGINRGSPSCNSLYSQAFECAFFAYNLCQPHGHLVLCWHMVHFLIYMLRVLWNAPEKVPGEAGYKILRKVLPYMGKFRPVNLKWIYHYYYRYCHPLREIEILKSLFYHRRTICMLILRRYKGIIHFQGNGKIGARGKNERIGRAQKKGTSILQSVKVYRITSWKFMGSFVWMWNDLIQT